MKSLRKFLKSFKKWASGLSISRILPFGFLLALPIFLYVKTQKVGRAITRIRSNPTDTLIYETLLEAGYNPMYWVVVARHETGNYTSSIYENARNLFGMKLPKIRPTTAIGEFAGHARYFDRKASVDDLILYMDYFDYPKSFSSLSGQVRYMKEKGYFGDSYENYYNACNRIWNQLQK